MELFTVPAQGLDVPGWFGKLPGMGDFGQRRLPPRFRAIWDEWLQKGLQNLRAGREDWVAHYLHAPIWFFALGEDVMSPSPWIGVLMPSVDSVGRYFPLTLAIELVRSNEASAESQMAHIHQWWLRSAKAGLRALDANMDAASFDVLLQSLFREPPGADRPCLSLAGLPGARMSSWRRAWLKRLPTCRMWQDFRSCSAMRVQKRQTRARDEHGSVVT
jgi:type VI secretion system protein ImpM